MFKNIPPEEVERVYHILKKRAGRDIIENKNLMPKKYEALISSSEYKEGYYDELPQDNCFIKRIW